MSFGRQIEMPLIPPDTFAQRLNNLAANSARISADTYAPRGYSGALRRSIKAIPAEIEDGEWTAYVVAGTSDSAAKDYAKRQNEEVLRHAADPPNISFNDLDPGPKRKPRTGTKSGASEKKYQRGYREAVKTGNFKTYKADFLAKGYADARKEI